MPKYSMYLTRLLSFQQSISCLDICVYFLHLFCFSGLITKITLSDQPHAADCVHRSLGWRGERDRRPSAWPITLGWTLDTSPKLFLTLSWALFDTHSSKHKGTQSCTEGRGSAGERIMCVIEQCPQAIINQGSSVKAHFFEALNKQLQFFPCRDLRVTDKAVIFKGLWIETGFMKSWCIRSMPEEVKWFFLSTWHFKGTSVRFDFKSKCKYLFKTKCQDRCF